jgi:selenide,water dikinase
MNPSNLLPKQVVLVGGGHAHVHVLDAFGRRREPGVALTLVTRDLMTPYSGMLPGVIAGLYRPNEAHIDLVRLCAVTGTKLVHAEAVGLDRASKRVVLADLPPVPYDLLSIDVGITPALAGIDGAGECAVAVKPIGLFLQKLETLIVQCRRPDGPRRIAVIGGGAGGVELLLSLRTRLMRELRAVGRDDGHLSFTLVTEGEILATHNARARDAFRRVFAARKIALHEHTKAHAVTAQGVISADGRSLAADAVLVTTGAAAPNWFAGTGLALDAGGFIAVGPTLQATNDPDVFAAGDCAALVETPREKAGVYAVRAGPPLAVNLRRRARGEPLKPWDPQSRHLALISTGERYAVASRGWFKAEGAWLWRVKDWIDRRWMRRYQR